MRKGTPVTAGIPAVTERLHAVTYEYFDFFIIRYLQIKEYMLI